jgi:uncharacterized protein (TIGR03545 family)
VKVIRWKAAAPLGVTAVVLAGGWMLFGDWLVKRALEAAGSAIVGARVEIAGLRISLAQSRLTIHGLTVASPSEAFKNVVQADELDADFEALPLLQKKFIVDRLAATGLRFGTARATDGRLPGDSSSGPSPAQQIGANVSDWVGKLDLPVLDLARGKIDVSTLDPAKLHTPQAAAALAARADSASHAWNAALSDLRTDATADSTVALVARLKSARPTDLAALNDARRGLAQLKTVRDRVTALERGVTAGVTDLRHGAAALDSSKQQDYAFARSLVKLPALGAPQIGAALFGPAAVAKFERALYWTRLSRAHMPAGVQPHAEPGPKRVRRRGITVQFPKTRELPGFLLKQGEVSFALGDSGAVKTYSGRLIGLTNAPALYGSPTTFTATAPAVHLAAMLDHVRPVARDTVGGTLDGVRLPALDLPSLPIRLAPGTGTVSLQFALTGDSVRGVWQVRAAHAGWVRDSGSAHSNLDDLLWQVLSGVNTLDLEARVGGTITSPVLSVRSNLDQAISARLTALVGDQVHAAEARLRAQVDGIVDQRIAPVKAQVAKVTDDATSRLSAAKGRLADAQKQLEDRLRGLTGGLRLK